MRTKKIIIPIIIAVFILIVVCSVLAAFTLKQVNITFSVLTHSENVQTIQNSVDKFNGKNLLFLSSDDVKYEIEKNPYFKVKKIEKVFPNSIEVSVEERREVFIVESQGSKYFTDENGFVLSQMASDKSYSERDYIRLSLINVGLNVKIGEKISSDDIDLIDLGLNLAKEVRLTDCIESFVIEKKFDGEYHTELTFNTYTAVKIVIEKAEFKGKEKTLEAFSLYDNETSDYRKSNNKIIAHNADYNDKGYDVVWENR